MPALLCRLGWGILLVGQMLAAVGGLRAGIIKVTDCGAQGDGDTLCTAAIQEAIDAAARSGGPTVFIPPGRLPCAGAFALKITPRK